MEGKEEKEKERQAWLERLQGKAPADSGDDTSE